MPIVTFADSNYPSLLKETVRAPQQLFYEGNLDGITTHSLSVIGSRAMTSYGKAVVELLVPGLVKAGLQIVSGLAYGVDAYAHKTALKFGGICIAILGSGLQRIYPARNATLFQHIIKGGGCVMTEYAESVDPLPFHFPERNRIVAGMSPVTLIIEAGERSGTLITARQALDAGREVCVVPADITRISSAGAHHLLKQGARPVTCVEDILDLYQVKNISLFPISLRPALTGSLATLYDFISHDIHTIDELVHASGMSVSEVLTVLSVLELDGYIYCKENQWQKTY